MGHTYKEAELTIHRYLKIMMWTRKFDEELNFGGLPLQPPNQNPSMFLTYSNPLLNCQIFFSILLICHYFLQW